MPYSSIGMTQSFERDTNRLARSMQRSARRVRGEVDQFMQTVAIAGLGISQRRSFGVVDPTQKFPHLAWRIPVRRITGEYYRGWRLRRVGRGHWLVYNNAREAYFIEFGIHSSPRRVRRPIAKMTMLDISKRLPRLSPQIGNRIFRGSTGGGFRMPYVGGGGGL